MTSTADDFSYDLPESAIAQAPLAERDASRLLHLELAGPGHHHRRFLELPGLLREGDLLVFNDSRVIPARLLGHKAGTLGKVELLLVRPADGQATAEALAGPVEAHRWICLGQASKGLKPGAVVNLERGLSAEVLADEGGGEYLVRFKGPFASLAGALPDAGQIPLPPYIARAPDAGDAERYQTVYARQGGSVAAPTAGLHFTPRVLGELKARQVELAFVTLDVGPGTFLPVRSADLHGHVMHAERASIPVETAIAINRARADGRRIIAVGTTVVRTLESLALADGSVEAGAALTRLFIVPGHRFKVVSGLITNFHQPRSTLVMLVSALVGRERLLGLYREAVERGYRFLSYGDAMFVDPG